MSLFLKQTFLDTSRAGLLTRPAAEKRAYQAALFSGTTDLRVPYYFGTVADPDDSQAEFLILEDLSHLPSGANWYVARFGEAAFHLGAQQAYQRSTPVSNHLRDGSWPGGFVARNYKHASARLAILNDRIAWKNPHLTLAFQCDEYAYGEQLRFVMTSLDLMFDELHKLESQFPTICHHDLDSDNLLTELTEDFWPNGNRKARTILLDLGCADIGAPGADLSQLIFNGAWRTHMRRPPRIPRDPNADSIFSLAQLDAHIVHAYKLGYAVNGMPLPVDYLGRDVIGLTHRLTTALRFGPLLTAFLLEAVANDHFKARQRERYGDIGTMASVIGETIRHAVRVGMGVLADLGATPPPFRSNWELRYGPGRFLRGSGSEHPETPGW